MRAPHYSCLAAVLLLLLGLAFAARLGHAAGEGCTPATNVFCVTNSNDTTDTLSPNYAGSLRKAISDSNANVAAGANTIGFAIPGSGVHTITLAAVLPDISKDLTIDGFSQSGSVLNTNAPDQGGLNTQLKIEIVGTGGPGFSYTCCGGTFRTLTFQGLALHGFDSPITGQGATLTPKALLNVYGCFIGTKVDGTALPAIGNSGTAVRANYDNAHVGGTLAWQRNLLSGNGGAGVFVSPADASSSVVIEGNLIGTDAAGTAAIANGTPNNWPGVYVLGGNARNVRIGCTGSGCLTSASRNVISGNRAFGISIAPAAGTPYTGLEIKGNYIGVSWDGSLALPNGFPEPQYAAFGGGIQVSGNSDPTPAVIGGFGVGESNLIAFNDGPGINAIGASATSFFDSRANELHDNAGPGATNIAIGAGTEPLVNDAGDADTGNNQHQNWPEILTAEPVRGPGAGQVSMKVVYKVTSAPANASYPIRVDFHFGENGGAGLWFAQDSYPSSAGQGYVTATLPVSLPVVGATPWFAFWGPIVAIATNGSGYSSELSPVTDDWIFGDTLEPAP